MDRKKFIRNSVLSILSVTLSGKIKSVSNLVGVSKVSDNVVKNIHEPYGLHIVYASGGSDMSRDSFSIANSYK